MPHVASSLGRRWPVPNPMSWVRAVGSDHLLRNSFYITLTTATMAVLGFAFWVLSAHLVTPSQVGVATTLVSAGSMISYVSLLGLNSTFIGFLPTSRDRNAEISTGLLLVFAAALAFGTAYVVGASSFARQIRFVSHSPAYAAGFVVMTAFAAVNLATDSIFIAYRGARFNLIVDGLIQGGAKLLLPIVLIPLGAYGLFAASGLASCAAVAFSVLFLVRKFAYRPQARISRSVIRDLGSYSGASYLANLFVILPILVLPLIIIHARGATDAGCFYVAFQIANLLNAVSYAVCQSLFAEGSYGETSLTGLAARSGKLLAAIVLPACALLALLSGALLQVFGETYSHRATDALVLLALSAPAVALNGWISSLLRLTRQLPALVWSNVVFLVAVCALTAAVVHRGLGWVAAAWLVGNLLSGLVGGAALAVRAVRTRSARRLQDLVPQRGDPERPRLRVRRRHVRPQRHRRSITPAKHPGVQGLRSASAATTPSAPKVLVTHVYSNYNAGDAALLSVLLGDLRHLAPNLEITVLTTSRPAHDETFDGCPVRPSFTCLALSRYRLRVLKLVYSIYIVTATVCAAAVYRTTRCVPLRGPLQALVQRFATADVVVPVGGGYLRGRRGLTSTIELVLGLHTLVIAKLLGRPVVLYPQSIGPFGGWLQARLTAAVLRRVDRVIVREDVSVQLLRSLDVSRNVVRSVDGAFAFEAAGAAAPRLRWELAVPEDRLLVGITVRQWLDAARQDRYERAVAELADALVVRHRAEVVFIPQVTCEEHDDDDRVTSRQVVRHMQERAVVLTSRYDHRALKALYRELDFIVGTRFHSVIFSLTAFVPALAIAYEHKTTGIMSDLGLEKWVLDICEVTGPGLIERFDALLGERQGYLNQLMEVLPRYQQRALATRQLLDEVADLRRYQRRALTTRQLLDEVAQAGTA